MKIKGDDVSFSTGKERYAVFGIIGLSPEGEVTYGYDGEFWNPSLDKADSLTPEERIELGEYMTEKWGEFVSKAKKEANQK